MVLFALGMLQLALAACPADPMDTIAACETKRPLCAVGRSAALSCAAGESDDCALLAPVAHGLCEWTQPCFREWLGTCTGAHCPDLVRELLTCVKGDAAACQTFEETLRATGETPCSGASVAAAPGPSPVFTPSPEDGDAPALNCAHANAEKCQVLGDKFAFGTDGYPMDDRKSNVLWASACAGGSGIACTRLGGQYLYGYGVSADPLLAVELFERGCSLRDARGCSQLSTDIPRKARSCAAGSSADCHKAAKEYWIVNSTASFSRSYKAEIALETRGCELGRAASCSRATQLSTKLKDQSNTPGSLTIGNQRLHWAAADCVANRHQNACMWAALYHMEPEPSPSGYAASAQLCQMGSAFGCNRKSKYDSGWVPGDGRQQAFAGIVAVAGAAAGAAAPGIANQGNIRLAATLQGISTVTPMIERDMGGGGAFAQAFSEGLTQLSTTAYDPATLGATALNRGPLKSSGRSGLFTCDGSGSLGVCVEYEAPVGKFDDLWKQCSYNPTEGRHCKHVVGCQHRNGDTTSWTYSYEVAPTDRADHDEACNLGGTPL